MNEIIGIIDDEPDIIKLVSINLKKSGFKTLGFTSAKDFLKEIKKTHLDLIILDLMLPDMDGIEVCKYLKSNNQYSSIPIIMLTAKDDELDKILGLELGADDYVTKPFSPKELVARVKAVLRRNHRKKNENTKVLKIGDIVIDLQKYEVSIKNKKINLTTTEFKILTILAEKEGWIFSREHLLDLLWGKEKIVIDRTIDVHIRHLREKLGDLGKIIKNIRGVGYKLKL